MPLTLTMTALLLPAATAAIEVAPVWAGTWKLNVAASTWSPGPGLRAQTTTITPIDGGISLTANGIDAQGNTTHSVFSVKFDAGDSPYKGGVYADTVACARIDEHTIEMVYKVEGKVTLTSRNVFSADGKTRVMTQIGRDSQGRHLKHRLVYERQQN